MPEYNCITRFTVLAVQYLRRDGITVPLIQCSPFTGMRDFRESKLVAEKNQKWSGRPLHNRNKKAISNSQHSGQHRSVHVRCVRAGSLILVSPYSSCGVVCPAVCIQSHMPFRLCSLAQLPVLPPTQWCAMVDAVLHSLSHASQLACGAFRELSLSNLCSVWSLSLSLSLLSLCISLHVTHICVLQATLPTSTNQSS